MTLSRWVMGVTGLITAGLPCSPLWSQSSASFSRQEAVDSALAWNPALVVAREQAEQARARVVEATAFPDPSLSADFTGQTGLLSPGSRTGGDVGVGVTVPFPYKFHLRGSVSRADVESAQYAYTLLAQQTASQTAQAYDALLVALRHQSDLTEGKQLAEDFLEKTEARLDAGTAARIDVLRARVDLAAAVNALIANQRDIANARAGIDRLLGRSLAAPFEASDSLLVPDDLPALDSLLRRAQAGRPELLSLASQQAGARASTTLAREYWLPDLDLFASRNYAAGSPATYTTGVGFSIPLFFWNHRRGEVAESQHHEFELRAAYRDQAAQVDQDVRLTYAAAATAIEQAKYLRDDLLPEARQAYHITLVSYGLGGSSALDVLDARRTLLDAESQYADALGAANDARADLERAAGSPVGDLPSGDAHDK
ncbi:MAG TPA: TolC family protein [Gemmatimonadales bacterium]|nr:TolC family protein [Gemmatimonadales bacterium]